MNWLLTWGERSWSAEDLTGRHLTLIAVGLGGDTWEIEPSRGPVHLIARLAAFIAVADNREFAAVVAELHDQPAATLLEALTLEG